MVNSFANLAAFAITLGLIAASAFAVWQRGKALGKPITQVTWRDVTLPVKLLLGLALLVNCYGIFIRNAKQFQVAQNLYDISQYSTDIKHYQIAAVGIAKGGVPWRDFFIEYPAASAYLVAVPGLGDPNMSRQEFTLRYLMYIGLVLTVATLIVGGLWLLRAPIIYVGTGLVAWIYGVAFMGELTYLRMEPLIAVLTLGGLTALFLPRAGAADAATEDRHRVSKGAALLGGVLLGLAAAKLYPLFMIIALIPFIRGQKALAPYLIGIVIGLLPTGVPALLGPENAMKFLGYHGERHFEIGSLWGVLAQGVPGAYTSDAFGCIEWRFNGEAILSKVSTLLTVVSTLGPLGWIFWSKRRDLRAGFWTALASLAGFVVFNKVGSPQYATWLLSLGACGALLMTDRKHAIRWALSLFTVYLFTRAADMQMRNFRFDAEFMANSWRYLSMKIAIEVIMYIAIMICYFKVFRKSSEDRYLSAEEIENSEPGSLSRTVSA